MPAGGARPGAGRKPGKTTRVHEVFRQEVRKHGLDAVKVLIEIMQDKEAPQSARVSAAQNILDRGYGRPHQAITNDEGDGPAQIEIIKRVIRGENEEASD